MIQYYTFGSPNGFKVSIMLEETGLPYTLNVVNLRAGEQRAPEFLAINPHGKIPAIVDTMAEGGPLALNEASAIIQYLSDKTGKFMPNNWHQRAKTHQWLMFQATELGIYTKMLIHSMYLAHESLPQAVAYHQTEMLRALSALNEHLGQNEFLAGDGAYSIADIATFPLVDCYFQALQQFCGGDFPALERYWKQIGARPGVQRGMAAPADQSFMDMLRAGPRYG